jgi:predicted RNA-binding Zn-ribbon protein involved in translation (DUF1610 family)
MRRAVGAIRITRLVDEMNEEATYTCGACGEEIIIPIDVSQGASQEYVEDCPVCCRANVIRVEIDDDGEASVWSEIE